MAPFTFEHMIDPNSSEQTPQPFAEIKGNGTLPASSTPTQTAAKTIPTATPTHEQKDFRDILSYEDKWIGWDGPVWCNRYGRFENKAQAAEDDGYMSDNAVVHNSTHCALILSRRS